MEEAFGKETTIYIPVEGSSDVIGVTIGPDHENDPGDVVVGPLPPHPYHCRNAYTFIDY
jgi:hypothetical protein